MNAIESATAATSAATYQDAAARIPKQVLGQEDFLKLLVAQLSSQDPLNPQKDTEFIAQMAQFSSLEQSKAMQSDMSQMRADQQFLRANAVLGRQVTLLNEDQFVTGTVDAVTVEAGTPMLLVNGQTYDMSQVLSIMPVQTPTAKSPTTLPNHK